MKTKYWLYEILTLAIIGIIVISGCTQRSTYTPSSQAQKVSYTVEKEIDDEISPYLSFSYDCKDIGKSIKCDGTINYIGSSEYKISQAKLFMYCYKQVSPESQCTVGSDSVPIGEMSADRNQLPFTVTCNYGNHKNFRVKLELTSGITVLPISC